MTDLLTDPFIVRLRAKDRSASAPLSAPPGLGSSLPRMRPGLRSGDAETILSPDMIQRGTWDGCLPLSNDERRARWASKYYGGGHHHRNQKPRIRVRA